MGILVQKKTSGNGVGDSLSPIQTAASAWIVDTREAPIFGTSLVNKIWGI
jgi:hypothetical protein